MIHLLVSYTYNTNSTTALELSQSLGSLTWQGCDSPQDGASPGGVSPTLPTAFNGNNATATSNSHSASTTATTAPHSTTTSSSSNSNRATTTATAARHSTITSSNSRITAVGDAPVADVATDVAKVLKPSAITATSTVTGNSCNSDSDDDENVQNDRCTSDVPMFEALLVIGVPQQWDLRYNRCLLILSKFYHFTIVGTSIVTAGICRELAVHADQ
jgi:hypothetical protein